MNVNFIPVVMLLTLMATWSGCDDSGNKPSHPEAIAESHAHSHGEAEKTQVSAESEQKEIEASIALLPPEEQALAKAQGFCAVMEKPLGSMGMPIKLSVNNETIFVCCKGCSRKALAEPEKTLAKVSELKARVLQQQK